MLRSVTFALITSVASFAVPAALATSSHAQPAKSGPGTAAVKQANDTIAGLLKQKVAPGSADEKALATKVTASVRNFLDTDQLGKAAMVDQWSKLKQAEQDEFLKVLRELIEANYIKGLRANVSYTVTYLGETTDKAGNIVVNTEVHSQRKGRPFKIAIDYVLAKNGAGYRMFDMKTDGVGLVENYRTMFNKLIKDKGFAAVIQTMKNKAAEISASTATPPAKT